MKPSADIAVHQPKKSMSNIAYLSSSKYNSYNNEGGADGMDIQKYIDRLDQDRRDMEERLAKDAAEREARYRDEQQAIAKDSAEREARYHSEQKAAEQRYREDRAAFEERMDARFTNIDQRFERMEHKIDKLSDDVRKDSKTTIHWVIGILIAVSTMVVATVIGIAAIVQSIT